MSLCIGNLCGEILAAFVRQFLGLFYPVIAFDAALEVQCLINFRDLGLLEASNLPIVVNAELVERFFQNRAYTSKFFEIIRIAVRFFKTLKSPTLLVLCSRFFVSLFSGSLFICSLFFSGLFISGLFRCRFFSLGILFLALVFFI